MVELARAAHVFNIPTTITTVESESFSGYTYPELLDVFPGYKVLERTSMNSWDDQKVRDSLAVNGRKKVVVAGLWTRCAITRFRCARWTKATTKSTWSPTHRAARRRKRMNIQRVWGALGCSCFAF
ncbi:UNVERIFIED_ORG: nicotinamidase-related amidase [Burkholderia sp. 1263]